MAGAEGGVEDQRYDLEMAWAVNSSLAEAGILDEEAEIDVAMAESMADCQAKAEDGAQGLPEDLRVEAVERSGWCFYASVSRHLWAGEECAEETPYMEPNVLAALCLSCLALQEETSRNFIDDEFREKRIAALMQEPLHQGILDGCT